MRRSLPCGCTVEREPDATCRGNFGETLDDARHVHVAKDPERPFEVDPHTRGIRFLPIEHERGQGPFCVLSTYRACGGEHRTGHEAFAAFESVFEDRDELKARLDAIVRGKIEQAKEGCRWI